MEGPRPSDRPGRFVDEALQELALQTSVSAPTPTANNSEGGRGKGPLVSLVVQ
jgi:hypothetical protein